MNNEELREFNKKRKIYQIAWVTRDLEKSMKAYTGLTREKRPVIRRNKSKSRCSRPD